MERTGPTSLTNIEEDKYSLTGAVSYKKKWRTMTGAISARDGGAAEGGRKEGNPAILRFGPEKFTPCPEEEERATSFWGKKTGNSGWTRVNSVGDILAETTVTACRHVALTGWEGHSLLLFLLSVNAKTEAWGAGGTA